MLMVCILVRWTMMSSTCRSLQVEHAAEHRRIALGDRAADGLSSMVPRISSCAARMLAASSRLVGVSFRIRRTMYWMAVGERVSRTMITRMIGATNSATRSANASA